MNIALRFFSFFVGLGVAFVVATNISHLDKTSKFTVIAICTICLGYLFTRFNIRMMQRTGELSAGKVLKPNHLGHVSLIIGALVIGYGFSVNGRILLLIGFVLMWLADDLLTKTCSETSNQEGQQSHWLHQCLFALFQKLIGDAQKSIGLVSYKLTPDQNGMVSVGDLMKQPWTFEFHVAYECNYNEKTTCGSHVVISKSDYKVIQYSSDPREGIQTRTFASSIEVARYVASLQIMTAINQSMSQDDECRSLNPKGSYEQLKRHSDLIQQHRRMLEERLDQYLKSIKARLINLLISKLSKLA